MICKAQKLRNIVTLEKGKPPAQQPYFGQDAELYLTPEYLRGRTSAEPVKPSANAVRVVDGDTVVLWDGSNAGEFFKARKGILASTMSRISHDDTFDKDYFFYAVKYWESYLKGQTSGSGIPHVDKEVLSKLEVFQFERLEQTKIAKILSTVDRAIEQTEALIAKQQRIKTGLMQDLLTCGIDEHGNIRSEQTHTFKDSPLGRIPEERIYKTLSEVYAEIPRNGIFKTAKEIGMGTLMIGQTSFTNNRRINYQLSRKAKISINELLSYGLQENDILITRVYATVDGVGLPVLVEAYPEPAVYESNMLRLRVNTDQILPIYVFYWLMSAPIRTFVIASVNASNQTSINQKVIGRIPVSLPTKQEQETIVDILAKSEKCIEDNAEGLRKLRSLKTALMQDLLTGKKRVT